MRIVNRAVVGLLSATVFLVAFAKCADAAFILTVAPDGQGNVVAFGSGTLNTSAFTMTRFGGPFRAAFLPNYFFGASIFTGATVDNVLESTGINGAVTGPFSYGTGATTLATSSTGDMVGLSAFSLLVPDGYTSGNALSNQARWDGRSITDLGLTPGTYTYTWGSGANADSYSMVISLTAVPEPSVLFLCAAGSVALWRRRRDVARLLSMSPR